MNRRKFCIIALLLALPIAVIVPLRAARSWQPRSVEIPFVGPTPASGISDLLWRPNGLLLTRVYWRTQTVPETMNNWDGTRVPIHALSASSVTLDARGQWASLLREPTDVTSLELWDVDAARSHAAVAKSINAASTARRAPSFFAAWAISPDGTRVAWNNFGPLLQGVIGIADAKTGRLLVRLQPQTPTAKLRPGMTDFDCMRLVWSPSGDELAVVGLHRVRIFDAQSGRLARAWPRPQSFFGGNERAAWSPDGKQLAISNGNDMMWMGATAWMLKKSPFTMLWVHDTQSGKVSRSWSTAPKTGVRGGGVTNLSWSPDNKHLAWGTFDGDALIMNASSGQIERKISANVSGPLSSSAHYVAYAPDGATLAVATQSRIMLWRVE